MVSVIISSRIAALLWCHCCAFNTSVITDVPNVPHSQKRLSREELSF